MSTGRSVSKVRVRYAETDKMGVVYYANYFVWFEVGRTDMLREAGWSYREMEGRGISLPVIEAHCEYRQPARYDDDVEIRTAGRLLSPVRVEFAYDVYRPSDGTLLASGRTVHASLDATGRPARLPARVQELLKESRGGSPDGMPVHAATRDRRGPERQRRRRVGPRAE